MKRLSTLRVVGVSLLLVVSFTSLRAAEPAEVSRLKVTILSTMLADQAAVGEWGFSALVEVDGHRILFDTGNHPDVVLRNARSLDIDLTSVPEVILSHNHSDHVGGLMTLREAVMKKHPEALSRVHVGEGIFYPYLWSIAVPPSCIPACGSLVLCPGSTRRETGA